VYSVLLMIPVGALVIVLLRNFVGVKTFGTFMPVLIALAFRETRLLWGLVLFAVIVSLGLLIRFYLEKLRLLLVPRLTCVLTVVVLLMAAISVVSQKLDLQPALSIALFPMVIISMTIERMSIVWEERGASEAIQEGVGSLLVAALAYLVMGMAWLEHLVFVFPELLLLVIALSLLMGRYTGYRLLELRRFRALAREQQA
ncbi:MAG TPA: 7TM domain-containing protein, partial [Steroidobacteraceae bacterium]